jgi:hypothetical protein
MAFRISVSLWLCLFCLPRHRYLDGIGWLGGSWSLLYTNPQQSLQIRPPTTNPTSIAWSSWYIGTESCVLRLACMVSWSFSRSHWGRTATATGRFTGLPVLLRGSLYLVTNRSHSFTCPVSVHIKPQLQSPISSLICHVAAIQDTAAPVATPETPAPRNQIGKEQ